MRLVAGVLSLALFAPLARAEEPATPPAPPAPAPGGEVARARVPFRVVRVMPETRQALLFDRSRNTHVLVEVGGKLDGYAVEDIDDETVSLRRDNQEVVLAAPPQGAGRDREPPPVRSAWAARTPDAAPAPAPPAPGASSTGPIDPYGDPPRPADALPPEPGIRVAHAGAQVVAQGGGTPGIVPGDGGVRVAVAPDVGPGPGVLPAAGPAITGPGAIRVVSAAPGGGPALGPRTGGPGEVAEPMPTVRRAPAAVPTAMNEPAADPRLPETREVQAADAVRAPDKQTADARALADIMTADHPTRSPRGPAELSAPPRAAEVRPAPVAAPAAAAAPAEAIAIPRSELDSALADFARLTAGVHGSFSASGAVIDGVGDGTIFQRAGLRAGDVVASVDGIRLRTLDDAANLYARAASARTITAQVLRAGKPVTLHLVIQ